MSKPKIVNIKGTARGQSKVGQPVLCVLCNQGIHFEKSERRLDGTRKGKGCGKTKRGAVFCNVEEKP